MALSIQMLDNAEEDLGHIEDVSTSTLPTATDRLGNEKMTVAGAVATIAAVNNRGAWASGTAYAMKDLSKDGGVWYFCVEPHTSGATFAGDAAYWRVYQGTVPSEVPYTVATYSALRSYAGDAYAVNVSGYLVTAAPDGVAGHFTRDDDDTTTADNGGTVIVDSSGRRWKRVFDGAINVRWFGADGVGDDTTAIQNAINSASFGVNRVYAPRPASGTYTVSKLYFQYDATNNAGFNSANRAQGRIIFYGDGQCDDGQAITGDWDESGTTIVCTETPGIIASKSTSPYPIRSLQLSHLTIVGNGAGKVVDFGSVHTNSALKYVTVVQQHKDGHGIGWTDSYMIDAEGLLIINTANSGDFTGALTITGHGLILKNPTLAGGQYNLSQMTVQGFKRGFELGEHDYSVAAESCAQISLVGVQALKCETGFDIGRGVTDLDSMNIRTEQCVSRGVYVHAFARNVRLRGRFANPLASDCDVRIGSNTGDAVEDVALNVSVVDATFSSVATCGIRFYVTSASTKGLVARRNRFVAATSSAGTGIEITAATLSRQQNAPRLADNDFTSLATNISGPYVSTAGSGSRHAVTVVNGDFTEDSDADGTPDGWTLYTGTGSLGSGVDPYGTDSSYEGSNGAGTDAPIYQVINFPANTLLKFTYWVKSIANAVTPRVRLTDAGASSPTIQDLDTTAPTSTPTLREVYWYSGANTSARLELRGAEFSMLRVEDVQTT